MHQNSFLSRRSRSRHLAVSLSLCLSVCTAPLTAQDETDEEDSPYRPGLVANYSAGGRSATRLDEALAFDWQDAPPDSRLTSGKFSATWTGRLWVQTPGEHRLAVYVGGGKATLRLAGREILAGQSAEPGWIVSPPIGLEFDRHPLEISFEQTGPQARLALYWSGPGFRLEPVPERFLMHDRERTLPAEFERGRRLATALRCGACHGSDSVDESLSAPALDRLAGNIHSDWLVDWLSQLANKQDQDQPIVRRMPHFGLTREEAADVAAWLERPTADALPEKAERENSKGAKGKGKESKASAEEGKRLFLTLGCLACHQHGELGESGLFGGGDLSKVAAKRPSDFFARWLADPAGSNRHHRMPVFELSATERDSLALFLQASGALGNALRGAAESPATAGKPAEGERLVARFRCGSCHALPGAAESPKAANLRPLTEASDWSRSCAGESDVQMARPGYRLADSDRAALKAYFEAFGTPQRAFPIAPPKASSESLQAVGRDLLVELNCLACHAREGINREVNALPARLQDKLAAVVAIHDDLGKQVPAMTPPALASVGDKLHDAALAATILRKDKPHRPYLLVRMPKFKLTDEQLAALTAYFTVTDRIPSREGEAPAEPSPRPVVGALAAAGPRLVTADGFACTSCHQIGDVLPDKAPLNARGPDLSMLEKRIRPEWFNRWCNNPARIVPRMEMPSVQVPVRGVLGEQIDDQLAAVWHILNTPGFQPPEPNPVRVLRLSGVPEKKEQPIVLHDVIKDGNKTYLFPLVVGLPNRHNVLFDLETNRLAGWWLGDTARQRTKGKSWYWEQGAESIFDSEIEGSELTLIVDGKELQPRRAGQFAAAVADVGRVGPEMLPFHRNVQFDLPRNQTATLRILEIIHRSTSQGDEKRAMVRELGITGLPTGMTARLRFVRPELFRKAKFDRATNTLTMPSDRQRQIKFSPTKDFQQNEEGSFDLKSTPDIDSSPTSSIMVEYRTDLPSDEYLVESPPTQAVESIPIEIAPGFVAKRLPLSDDLMPSALDWKPDGRLVFATLKGQAFVASDTSADGLEDKLELLEDGLATPYGVAAGSDYVDVLVKTGLVRLNETDEGSIFQWQPIASGWGVTDDYHDWAVGLVRGDAGEYYIGLPCQQDDRSDAAAKHRGQLLKLVPRKATPDNPRLFDIEVVSSGHRFPMGLARNRDGELFVTDNQGNYNPFNELNHVRPGAHFGFINANEKEKGFKPPPLAKPAIDIPHPWTRSVNGICFLETPVGWVKDAQHSPKSAESTSAPRGSVPAGAGLTHPTAFGPLEGHLVGCEYDTRQLIRMTLQKVGDTYQGAAYPLSIPPENVENGLLGPIVCAVSPRGELYVGNIRDSGWGAGNNIGDIVQIKIEPEKLPCGIAEVRATSSGFTLDFFRPVDAAKAKDAANYSIASYRRESTPAYGGPNLDRRIETIAAVEVSPDAKRVTLKLSELREGFVYEFQLKPLTRGKAIFHPAEAHYTLNKVP
jgi:mono/diheme cytochrome c family protein